MLKTEVLSEKYFKIFMGAYNDFRTNCKRDYRFELDPLEYADFIEYNKKGIIKTILLLEGAIPTGFLAYSEAENGAIELYIIHCLGSEEIIEKKKKLIETFLFETVQSRKQRIVSYPMLGLQDDFKEEIKEYGFNFVELAVFDFPILDKKETKALEKIRFSSLPIGYKIIPYKDIYKDGLKQCVLESFAGTSDIYFDPRFKTGDGVSDIVNKITDGIYGRFLNSASKILLYENVVSGFCLANTTGSSIANIPLVGILPLHRGLGLSEVMVKMCTEDVIKLNTQGIIDVNAMNVSTDYNNVPAVKMYEQLGFKLSYTYPQAYLSESEMNYER